MVLACLEVPSDRKPRRGSTMWLTLFNSCHCCRRVKDQVWSAFCEVIFLQSCVCHQGWAPVFRAHNVVVAFIRPSATVTVRCVSWHWTDNSHVCSTRFCGLTCESDSSGAKFSCCVTFLLAVCHRITLLLTFEHFGSVNYVCNQVLMKATVQIFDLMRFTADDNHP